MGMEQDLRKRAINNANEPKPFGKNHAPGPFGMDNAPGKWTEAFGNGPHTITMDTNQ